MPADFDKCVKDGGKVRTLNLKKDKYMHVCYDKDGTSHSGEVLTKKKKSAGLVEQLRNLYNKWRKN